MQNKLLLSVFLLLSFISFSQNDNVDDKGVLADVIVAKDTVSSNDIDPLTPSKAAFYSAILPGLGQAYNKKYWKIPIVYAGLGTGMYFYFSNNKQLKRYRDAYKRRLAGFEDDEFFGRVSNEGLIRAQRTYRRNKEISLLVTLGIYALNIIDANVDAHLLQYNVDDNLAIKPHFKFNDHDARTNLGLTLKFKF